MAIPDYQTLMLPLLKALADKQERSLRDAVAMLANEFGLNEDERTQLLPSGGQSIMANRVAWAKTYLKKAGLVDQPKRGYVQLTTRGEQVLKSTPVLIDIKFLEQFSEFVAFRDNQEPPEPTQQTVPVPAGQNETPEELIEGGARAIKAALADELLQRVRSCSPNFFEHLVVELLVKMGYGGSRKEAGNVVGRSGDGGIDGVINEDKLGLDTVYVQAKRWQNSVGVKEVRDFKGALDGHAAVKGVLITTGAFNKGAIEVAANSRNYRIVLIDGDRLARLMIDHNVGVSLAATYEIKKIDSDYFLEE